MKKKSGTVWQSAQSRIKKKKKVKLALFILSLVFATIIAGNLLRFLNSLFEPVSSGFNSRTYRWDGKTNLNLVYKNNENISLLTINPAEKKILSLEVPSNTFIAVPGGFGDWEVRSIFALGGEDLNTGSALLKESISGLFGLPIDGFLSSEGGMPLSVALRNLSINPFSVIPWINKFNTDLTPIEMIRLYVFLQQVRSDNIESFDSKTLDVLTKTELADGTYVYLPNSMLDRFIQENFSEPQIKNEQAAIAVLNGTDSPGLAKKFSRLISNMGGNVIISDNTQYKIQYTTVIGVDSKTKKRLKQIFAPKYGILSSKHDQVTGNPASRAQITVMLGEDLLSP